MSLDLIAASATFPGLATTGTQTFAGDKTFTGTVNLPTFTSTGDWTYAGTATAMNIKANTADGSDINRIRISSGGAASSSRGANFQMFGNDFGSSIGGLFDFVAGDSTDAAGSNTAYQFNASATGGAATSVILKGTGAGAWTWGTTDGQQTHSISGRIVVGNQTNNCGTNSFNTNNASATDQLLVLTNASTNTASDAAEVLLIQKSSATTTTSARFVRFNTGSGGSGYITASSANNATFTATSDVRTKENIQDLSPQLANILALRPVNFDYKSGINGLSPGPGLGFIAQEMQQIYPDSVCDGGDGWLQIGGWDRTSARLVKAIQELSAKNDGLEARLAALES